MLGIDFVMFVLLGFVVFVPLQASAKIIAMVVYVVVMILWFIGGLAGWPLHLPVR